MNPASDAARRRVPTLVRWRVFARSLLLMAGFNPRTMQGLGALHAMAPALEALYPDPVKREIALQRHLGFFNTHPYFAAALFGGLVRLEERVASGLSEPDAVATFRQALCAPLAAIGDAFFWNALRPAAALVAILSIPALGLGAPLLFLGLYDAVQLSVRVWLFASGYRHAEGVVAVVGRARFPVRTLWLRRLSAALLGVVAAMAGARALGLPGPQAACALAGLAAGLALAPRVGPYLLAAVAVLVGIVVSIL